MLAVSFAALGEPTGPTVDLRCQHDRKRELAPANYDIAKLITALSRLSCISTACWEP